MNPSKPDEMYVYKIKCPNPDFNFYSTGGISPSWKKEGKTWTTYKALQLHIKMIDKHYAHRMDLHPYNGAEVVSYKVFYSYSWKIIRTKEKQHD